MYIALWHLYVYSSCCCCCCIVITESNSSNTTQWMTYFYVTPNLYRKLKYNFRFLPFIADCIFQQNSGGGACVYGWLKEKRSDNKWFYDWTEEIKKHKWKRCLRMVQFAIKNKLRTISHLSKVNISRFTFNLICWSFWTSEFLQ